MEKSKECYVWLGQVPVGIGAIIRGWDILEKDFRNQNILPVVDFRAMGPSCPHDCDFCFTDKNKKTLSLFEIKRIITEISQAGARGINFLGEGEPTLDKDFFEIIEYTSSLGVIPIVFTEGAMKLQDRDFVKRLKATGASVIPKCDSLFNPNYQNMVVKDNTGRYFNERNHVVKLLIEEGFNEPSMSGTTRMGFDMVISKDNISEIPETLRFCRQNNIWIIFSLYLPSGRVVMPEFDSSSYPSNEQIIKISNEISRIDEQGFSFVHPVFNNFITYGCVERLQIFGDGRVSPCPGNEIIIGNVLKNSIQELNNTLLQRLPKHNPCSFDGYCIYRKRF